jgi:hypothetical protein
MKVKLLGTVEDFGEKSVKRGGVTSDGQRIYIQMDLRVESTTVADPDGNLHDVDVATVVEFGDTPEEATEAACDAVEALLTRIGQDIEVSPSDYVKGTNKTGDTIYGMGLDVLKRSATPGTRVTREVPFIKGWDQ